MKEGKFPATVLRHEFTVSSKESKGIYFRLAVDFDGEQEEVGHTLWLTEGTFKAGIVGRTLKAMGFDYRTESLQVLGENDSHLTGREVSVVVGEEEDQRTGDLALRVKFINPPRVKLEKSTYDELTEELRKWGQAGESGSGGEEEKKDEIPF